MTNPTAGHTSGTGIGSNSQGLRDGDGLTSPSLTNIYEALHGNGIMRLGDGARGDSLRNSIVPITPGFVEALPSGVVKVYGGYCVIDGAMYKFANGPGSSELFEVGVTGNYSGDLPSVPSSNSEVYVVIYLVGRNTPKAHLMYEIGTPVSPSSGTPLIPNRFLSSPSVTGNTDGNHQHTVLAVLRYTMTGGAANVNASLSSTASVDDRRAYIRTSPFYLTPMTKGSIGNVDTSNALTDLDSFFSSPEDGDFDGSPFGAMWQSHYEDKAGNKHANIYASIPRNLNTTPATNTYVMGPNRLEVVTTSGNLVFTFDQADLWVITTDQNRTINPNGNFGIGHVVQVYHAAGAHDLRFDTVHGTTPINVNITNGEFASFVYDGNNWKQISSANGVSTTGTVTSVATTAPITGGTITGTGTIGISAATTSAAGSMSAADKTKLNAIEASATADQTNAEIRTAVEAATDSNVFTDADHSKLNAIEASATADQTDAEIRAAVEAATDSNVFTDADHSKLNGIEASADVTDTANVVAALTAGTNVAIAGDGTISATDTNTTYTVGDGGLTQKNFTTTLKNKLDAIEASATADQTDAEIRAAVEAATDSNVFTDADHSKLNGIEASATADQTNAEIRAAVEAATDSNVFTDADHTKLNGIASSATAYADSDAISAVEGEADLALSGDVTVATGKSFVSRRLPVVALTASTPLTEADHAGKYIFVTGSSIVITIPDNQGAGVHFTIINNDGNGFTLRTGASSSAGDNMNGAQTDIAVAARNGVTCISTGTDYVVLGA